MTEGTRGWKRRTNKMRFAVIAGVLVLLGSTLALPINDQTEDDKLKIHKCYTLLKRRLNHKNTRQAACIARIKVSVKTNVIKRSRNRGKYE